MILTIYLIILTYFLLGGIGFYFINRKKDPKFAHHNKVKFITYFFIINILFLSIVFKPWIFRLLGVSIAIMGLLELVNVFRLSGKKKQVFFVASMVIYLFFCLAFFSFSQLDKEFLLFTFLILSIFDAFSQISGQLLGRRKILPSISPNKTVEGLIGGLLIALFSSFLLRGLVGIPSSYAILMAGGIILFAFIGDLASSLFKRQYGVKDYSDMLPGHGGILDRFDSLIAGGAFVAIFNIFVN